MKDEIKEILELHLYREDYNKLLDYITNLQEENERLKEIVENLTTMTASGDGKQIKNTAQFKLDICKQRIDKSIEYINKHFHWGIDGNDNIDDLLNILKGE